MPDIHFNCPNCQSKLVVDAAGAGLEVPCPECNERIIIPTPPLVHEEEEPAAPAGNTCTRCGKKVILDTHQIVAECEAAGIPLTWGHMGPTLTRGHMSAVGLNEIFNLLVHSSSTKSESFQAIIASWAPHGRCPTCGEQWCHACISGPLPDEHMVKPPYCKCG